LAGGDFRGEETQESTDPTTSPWPGQGSPRERTPGGSKASKWACRPFSGEPDDPERGEAAVGALRRVRRTSPGGAGNPDPGSCVRQDLRVWSWQRVGAGGKAPTKLEESRAGGGRTRTHTEAQARESGYGSPRGESSEGHLQGRERHGTRPRSVGASRKTACPARGTIRSAYAARSVERGKNPEDGTGEGSASSRPPHGRLSCRRGVRGTRRSRARGRKKPRRDGSRGPERSVPLWRTWR